MFKNISRHIKLLKNISLFVLSLLHPEGVKNPVAVMMAMVDTEGPIKVESIQYKWVQGGDWK